MKKYVLSILCAVCLFVSILFPSETMNVFADTNDPYTGPYVNDEYGHFKSVFRKGPQIPGTSEDNTLKWVPQGLTYVPASNIMMTSNYWKDETSAKTEKASTIALINMSDNSFMRNFYLLNPDGSEHKGHVGGITVANNYLWIASSGKLYRLSLQRALDAADNEYVRMEKEYNVPASSTITSRNGELWLGEYVDTGDCNTDEKTENAPLYRYSINSNGDPVQIGMYTMPDEVQGIAITDNYFLFSRSCGRTNESYLSIYKKLDGIGPDWQNGFWDSMKMLPMSEGIVEVGNKMYVLFESWAPVYRFGEDNDGDYTSSSPTKWIHYAETGFIIPDYSENICCQETWYAPDSGKMRTWTESVDNLYDLRVEVENVKYNDTTVSRINDSSDYPSISFDGEDTLDNDSWNRTYTNYPNPEFDNFDPDSDGIDNDDVVRVTAQSFLSSSTSYYFGSSFEVHPETLKSGEIKVYANMSYLDGSVYNARETDYIGAVNWAYGIPK